MVLFTSPGRNASGFRCGGFLGVDWFGGFFRMESSFKISSC